jgi:hypothetical protein
MYFKIYAPFVAINRTNLMLKLHGLKHNLYLNPYSSLLVAPLTTRLSVSIDEYEESKSFLINTFGVSGAIRIPKIPKKKKKANTVSENPIDPALDPN